MSRKVQFYFDFISPYAYFAAYQLEPWRQSLSMELEIQYTPILFAGTLNHWGHKGPAEIPPKRTFTYKDAIRQAHALGLRLKFPPFHPFNPLLALRVATLLRDSPQCHEIVLDIFHATWRDGLDITDPAVLQQRLEGMGVEKAADVMEQCLAPENKLALRTQTESAVNSGVFGVPMIVIDDELFWGCDQFDYIKDYLLGQDPVQEYPSDISAHPVGASRT